MANKKTLQELMKNETLGGLSTLEIAQYLNERVACESAEIAYTKTITPASTNGTVTAIDEATKLLQSAANSILKVCECLFNAEAKIKNSEEKEEECETLGQFIRRIFTASRAVKIEKVELLAANNSVVEYNVSKNLIGKKCQNEG